MTRQTYLKKGTWSCEEDEKLIAYIMKYGIWNWNEMPKFAGLQRSGKSCRFRWMNYLKPNTRRGNFTKEEEETIIQLQKMLGNRWSAIAARLPQRTDNDIKNYWNTRLKKRVMLDNYNNNHGSASIEPESDNSFPWLEHAACTSSSIEFEQENAPDVDSSTLFDIPTMEDFSELFACHQTVQVDSNTCTTKENFVSSQNYWESVFLEETLMVEGLDCEVVSPNHQLYYDNLDDFWVNPLI